MSRCVIAMVVVLGMAACDEGKTINYVNGSDVVGGADAALDVAVRTDAPVGDAVQPDGSVPTDGGDTNVLPDSGADVPVGPSDTTVTDSLEGEVAGDVAEGDIAPFEPFAGCGEGAPCPHAQEPLCLLLPGSDQGICVKACGGDDGACPPWLECVQPDPGNDDLNVCLDVQGLGNECDTAQGLVCKPGTYCVTGGAETGVCTTFCIPGEGICPTGTTCTLVDPADASWGACLPEPDWSECSSNGDCQEDEVCGELVPGYLRCAPSCKEAGAGCGTFGLCTAVVDGDGAPANVCLTYQEQGQICDTAKGLFCQDTLKCLDLAAPDGWHRCVKDCVGGLCDDGYVCHQPDGAPKEMCLPLEMTLADPVFCNGSYPCVEEWQVCTQGEDEANGICAPPCGEDEGCPPGQACRNGGCVPAAPIGASCLPGKGLFCQGEGLCLADKTQSDKAGYCAQPCTEGDDGPCGGLTTCQAAGDGLFACLVGGAWGEPCSLDEGLACDGGQGLTCIHIANTDDFGFCTGQCEGPGTCPQQVENATAECMLQKAGTWYCAFVCGGGFGSVCPEGMSCSGFNMCTP